MATYLVTGGCGFIGSHLVDLLVAQNHRVRVLDDLSTGKLDNLPVGVELYVGDVADAKLVARAMQGVDGCFHLAAIASVQRSVEEWVEAHRVNLTGTIAVFDAARRAGRSPVPVVYASSAAVYGDSSNVPLAETTDAFPLSAYGADKLGCEHHARVATRVHGVPTTGLRFFNVFGPRQDPKSPYSGVIAIFARTIGLGNQITIYGDGEQVRDFVYVENVVRYLVAAMTRSRAEARVFNVCTGRATSVNQLASAIANIAGRQARIDYQPARTGDIRASVGDPRKANAALGVTAGIGLVDGLTRTLAGVSPRRTASTLAVRAEGRFVTA